MAAAWWVAAARTDWATGTETVLLAAICKKETVCRDFTRCRPFESRRRTAWSLLSEKLEPLSFLFACRSNASEARAAARGGRTRGAELRLQASKIPTLRANKYLSARSSTRMLVMFEFCRSHSPSSSSSGVLL